MVRFIAVDDDGNIAGSVAKPAIEAVAKPLVDAVEKRLTPAPTVKTLQSQVSAGDGTMEGPQAHMLRMVVALPVKVQRWRLRVRNVGSAGTGSGTFSSVGVYHGPASATNEALFAGTPVRVLPNFKIIEATEWVSAWVDSAPLGGGVKYLVGFAYTGTGVVVSGGTKTTVYTHSTASAQNQSVDPVKADTVPFAISIEYDAEIPPGAVAQGGIMQITKAEYMAAKAAGSLESGVFYAVTEGS